MFLLTSDWRLSDRPEDAYRWKFLEKLPELVVKHKVSKVFMLGNLTQQHDNHSAALVNRLVRGLLKVAEKAQVVLLAGKHDTPTDGTQPYWSWLNCLESIVFIDQPMWFKDCILWLLLPYGSRRIALEPDTKWIFTSEIYSEAKMNGQTLSGVDPTLYDGFGGLLFSGGLPTQQDVRRIRYVGAPYPVEYQELPTPPSIFLLDQIRPMSVDVLSLVWHRRLRIEVKSADELALLQLQPGDQLRVLITRDVNDWGQQREEIERIVSTAGAELHRLDFFPTASLATPISQSPLAVYDTYCQSQPDLDEAAVNQGRGYLPCN